VQVSQTQGPTENDAFAWPEYWANLGQPWRVKPEIDPARQATLGRRRAVAPDASRSEYPFKGMKLTRADIEWLLATHDNGFGPVDWSDEDQRGRQGLDLRGADLSEEILVGLPLAALRGGVDAPEYQQDAVNLRGALLADAHLEGAHLNYARLENATLAGAHFEDAYLRWAHLEGATRIDWRPPIPIFNAPVYLARAQLLEAHLEGAVLSGSYLEGADLGFAHLHGTALAGARLEGALGLPRLRGLLAFKPRHLLSV